MDNLESCVKRDINPIIADFLSKNSKIIEQEQEHSKNLADLRVFKQNLDKFIQEEKQRSQKSLDDIKSLLNNIYHNYTQEITQFSEKMKAEFESLEKVTKNHMSFPVECNLH
jgi:hypothetical protein